jgi:outer membrane receptor protein involved in Fe transport
MTPEGELMNSQFRDNNLSLKAAIKPKSNHELKVNYQRFFAKNVGIPGGSAFAVSAIARYPVELRDMISAGYTIKNSSEKLEIFQLKFFHQYILRDVKLDVGPNVTITPGGYHKTNGALLQTNWKLMENHNLIAGLDVWQRSLETEREKSVFQAVKDSLGNVIRTDHTIRGELPIPASRFTSGGVFIQDRFSLINKRLELSLGGRFDLINIRNDKAMDPLYLVVNDVRNDNPPDQRISFPAGNVNNVSWSTDLGFLLHAKPHFDVTLTASRAFRAPSLEERFKYIDLGTTVKIGDPHLKPEEGYFLDLGTRLWKDRLHLSTNLFLNSMQDLIIEIPGFAYYNYTNQPDRTDTVKALINSNVDKALLYGFDLMSNYNFYDGITLSASASYVRGMDTEKDNNLPLIPPLSGRMGIRYQTHGMHGLELFINLSAKQDKTGPGEKVTGGYASYDLSFYSAYLKLGFTKFKISGGIENITDRAYVNHLATNRGFIKYEPGRNFYLRLRFEM